MLDTPIIIYQLLLCSMGFPASCIGMAAGKHALIKVPVLVNAPLPQEYADSRGRGDWAHYWCPP